MKSVEIDAAILADNIIGHIAVPGNQPMLEHVRGEVASVDLLSQMINAPPRKFLDIDGLVGLIAEPRAKGSETGKMIDHDFLPIRSLLWTFVDEMKHLALALQLVCQRGEWRVPSVIPIKPAEDLFLLGK